MAQDSIRVYLREDKASRISSCHRWLGVLLSGNEEAWQPGDVHCDLDIECFTGTTLKPSILDEIVGHPCVAGASLRLYDYGSKDDNAVTIFNDDIFYVKKNGSAIDVFSRDVRAILKVYFQQGLMAVDSRLREKLAGYESVPVSVKEERITLGQVLANSFGQWWRDVKDRLGISLVLLDDIKTVRDLVKVVGSDKELGSSYASGVPIKLEKVGREVYVYQIISAESRKCIAILPAASFRVK